MVTVLVTGGAGYIGAHVVKSLTASGLTPVVVDDLSSGRREFLAEDVPFEQFTILDTARLAETLATYNVQAVIHVAAFKYAGVSVERPLYTWQQNAQGTWSVLSAMATAGVDHLVFSSTAAVYGTPTVPLVTERTPTQPQSPYGGSKLAAEWMIADQGRATGLSFTNLRYFNVVGSGAPTIYDASPHNLFPLVFDAVLANEAPRIFGDDYPTPDGTCVRDYVHVSDLADAHVVALKRLLCGDDVEPVYNLGSGDGVSVREIMAAVAEVVGRDFAPEVVARRSGDPARIVAAGELAARDLDWRMRHDLLDMVRTAWEARLTSRD